MKDDKVKYLTLELSDDELNKHSEDGWSPVGGPYILDSKPFILLYKMGDGDKKKVRPAGFAEWVEE